jgi:hypothetical protein
MAFTFRSSALSGHITEEETLLFDMLRLLRLEVPRLEALERAFYDSPTVEKDDVSVLREETLTALRAFEAQRDVFRRALTAKPESFRDMARSLREHDVLRALASLVAVCDDAMSAKAPVRCLSD